MTWNKEKPEQRVRVRVIWARVVGLGLFGLRLVGLEASSVCSNCGFGCVRV